MTPTVTITVLPRPSLIVILAVPAPTAVTVNAELEDVVTVATDESSTFAVKVPEKPVSCTVNVCVCPAPVKAREDGKAVNVGGIKIGMLPVLPRAVENVAVWPAVSLIVSVVEPAATAFAVNVVPDDGETDVTDDFALFTVKLPA